MSYGNVDLIAKAIVGVATVVLDIFKAMTWPMITITGFGGQGGTRAVFKDAHRIEIKFRRTGEAKADELERWVK